MKKTGFTLVELSIVLVIIGLLIGGILVGQSLIDSVKLNTLVRQTQQYDAAIMTFKDKYKVLPGESGLVFPVRTTGTFPAEKDGLITDDDQIQNTAYYTAAGSEEYTLFWKDMASLIGLKIKNCPSLATATPAGNGAHINGNNCNMPTTEYGANKNIMILGAAFTTKSYSSSYNKGNAYYFMDCSASSGITWSCMGAFTPTEAMAYDAKIDDGKAESGFVVASPRATPVTVIRGPSSTIAYDLTSTVSMSVIQRFPNGL